MHKKWFVRLTDFLAIFSRKRVVRWGLCIACVASHMNLGEARGSASFHGGVCFSALLVCSILFYCI